MSDKPSREPRALPLIKREEKNEKISLFLTIDKKTGNVASIEFDIPENMNFSTAQFFGWLEQVKFSMLFESEAEETETKSGEE